MIETILAHEIRTWDSLANRNFLTVYVPDNAITASIALSEVDGTTALKAYVDQYGIRDPNSGAVTYHSVGSSVRTIRGAYNITFVLEKETDELINAAAVALVFVHSRSVADSLIDDALRGLASRLGR